MSVECSAFVGYGWILAEDRLSDIISVLPQKCEDFWEEDDVERINAYQSNSEIFFGKRLSEKNLNDLLDINSEPSKEIESWRDYAYGIYDKYFTCVEIPEEPRFIIRAQWW